MLHYTLHTDDSRESSIDELSDEAIQLITGLLTSGTHRIPGLPGYTCRVAITGEWLIATVSHRKRPCVTLGVAPNEEAAEQLWPRLERLYFQITDMPGIRSTDLPASRRPTETPWCAVVRLGITPDEVGWIDFFERCLAWAWVERCQST